MHCRLFEDIVLCSCCETVFCSLLVVLLALHNFLPVMFLTFNLQLNLLNGYECDYHTVDKYRSLGARWLVTQQFPTF